MSAAAPAPAPALVPPANKEEIRRSSVSNKGNNANPNNNGKEMKGEFTEAEEEALKQLRPKVVAELGEDHRVTDYKLLRFIRARKFNIDAALKQYVDQVNWRKKNQVDRWINAEPPIMRRIVPESFHGFDKYGHPSYIVKTGRVDPTLVNRITIQDFINIHLWGMEYSFLRCEESSKRLGKNVDKFSNIVDLEGLSMNHRKCLKYMQALAKIDEKYYPETMHHTFIINAPYIFSIFWKIMKPWVDPVTATKISVLGSNFKEELLQHYDPKDLPVEYGGTCSCNGGCVKVFSEAEIKEVLEINEQSLQLTEETIKSGQAFETKIQTGDFGAQVTYYFATKANDIRFSAHFHPREAEQKKVVLITPEKVKSHVSPVGDMVEVRTAGTIVFTWDNTYSMWKEKYLRYVLRTTHFEEQQEDGDNVDANPELEH